MAAAIEDFAQIREVYIRKLEGFEAALGDNLATFRVAFPDFEPGDRVLVVHSLGELDGGVLTLNGRQTLVFGIDVMAAHHPFESESAFFHHELFHLYHSDDFGCAAVWCTLWSEGLATYVAHRLNPTATDAELLLDLPKGVVADTIAVEALAWERLEATLLSTDTADRAVLFQARPSPGGLPPRHGYYLGYRIVEELGQTRDLHALAALTPEEVLPLIQATVTEFRRGRASDRPEH